MPKNMLNGGQVIVDYLVREKVPYVFGLCGHGNIGFIDALHERSGDIKTISVHHETVAGFMADVYYRVAGKPVATFTSCGPGSANLPIALGNAYLDSDGVTKAVDMLLAAEQPVILVGQGLRYGGASGDLLALAERLQIPVGFSASGLGAMPSEHPLALGLVSRGGVYHANHATRQADVLLAL